jgi:8-oxo-dGTP pyrophosphatase MutT (NUDIX family)
MSKAGCGRNRHPFLRAAPDRVVIKGKLSVIGIQKIKGTFREYCPEIIQAKPDKRAAVALIVDSGHSHNDPEIIFIERAFHAADPWSGQMAFPGGRCDPQDLNSVETACRETQEEIGVDLLAADRLGRLDDLQGRHGGRSREMVISCFVFGTHGVHRFSPNHEVADVITLPISTLLDPSAQSEVPWPQAGRVFPGICVGAGERVIWGLTYRFLLRFFSLLGHSLPPD